MTEDEAIAWVGAHPTAFQFVLERSGEIFARQLGEPLATMTPEEITDLARKSIRAAVMLADILIA